MTTRRAVRSLGVFALGLLLAGLPADAGRGAGVGGTDPANGCRTRTVELGEISGWGHGAPAFLGEDLLIRDRAAWTRFWERHTSILTPSPFEPDIDFGRDLVIATVQGQ